MDALRSFPPEVAIHVVKLACERPDDVGRSVASWDCHELARQLIADGLVESISAETVRRILAHHRLKPWRHHMWLGAKTPRDDAFRQTVAQIVSLYTRPLGPHEVVLCFDEKTNLRPQTRLAETKPAQPGAPVRVEHEYKRGGASHLMAAFDTRCGRVYGRCYRRKRALEMIDLLNYLDRQIPPTVTIIHMVMDNLSVHKSHAVGAWLAQHPRFQFHFVPVHCSWMNQVEQWFGTLTRKRFAFSDFRDLQDLEGKILKYIEQYNETAHPYQWSTRSAARVMAWKESDDCDAA